MIAVPQDPGWGLQARWFSFIAVEAYELEGREAPGSLVHPAPTAVVNLPPSGE